MKKPLTKAEAEILARRLNRYKELKAKGLIKPRHYYFSYSELDTILATLENARLKDANCDLVLTCYEKYCEYRRNAENDIPKAKALIEMLVALFGSVNRAKFCKLYFKSGLASLDIVDSDTHLTDAIYNLNKSNRVKEKYMEKQAQANVELDNKQLEAIESRLLVSKFLLIETLCFIIEKLGFCLENVVDERLKELTSNDGYNANYFQCIVHRCKTK